MAELSLNLSESLVLPFEVVSYASFLERDLDKIESRYNAIAAENGVTFGSLIDCETSYRKRFVNYQLTFFF